MRYICINSWNGIKEKQLVDKLPEDILKKDIERCFQYVYSGGFSIRYNKVKKRKFLKNKIISTVYTFPFTNLYQESIELFYQAIGFYIFKIEEIDATLIDSFVYTIIDTLKDLNLMLQEQLEQKEINNLIINTGEVYKGLYESLINLEDDGSHKMRMLEVYNNNLKIKNQLVSDLKKVK